MEKENLKEINTLKYLNHFKNVFGEYEYHVNSKEKTKSGKRNPNILFDRILDLLKNKEYFKVIKGRNVGYSFKFTSPSDLTMVLDKDDIVNLFDEKLSIDELIENILKLVYVGTGLPIDESSDLRLSVFTIFDKDGTIPFISCYFKDNTNYTYEIDEICVSSEILKEKMKEDIKNGKLDTQSVFFSQRDNIELGSSLKSYPDNTLPDFEVKFDGKEDTKCVSIREHVVNSLLKSYEYRLNDNNASSTELKLLKRKKELLSELREVIINNAYKLSNEHSFTVGYEEEYVNGSMDYFEYTFKHSDMPNIFAVYRDTDTFKWHLSEFMDALVKPGLHPIKIFLNVEVNEYDNSSFDNDRTNWLEVLYITRKDNEWVEHDSFNNGAMRKDKVNY
jgi:hypothetical protein